MTMRSLSRIGLSMLLCIAAASMTVPAIAQVPPAIAPSSMQKVGKEQMTFTVGDILEVLPVHDFPSATYAWVLTVDEEFLQAGRAPFFRVRFIRPGTYTLHGEVTGSGNERFRRAFVMNVLPRDHTQSSSPASTVGSALVTTTPPADLQGRLVLRPGSQVVALSPVSIDQRPLFLDLDTNRDADGNGDPADDRQAAESFFETSALPLHLWLTSLTNSRTISIRSADGPTAAKQQIMLLTGPAAIDEGVVKPSIRIIARPIGPGTLQFSLVFDAEAPSVPLLARWNFGDGQESLLTEPTHSYNGAGEQTATVLLRNLLTGEEIASASVTVMPDGAGTATSAAGPVAQSSVASQTQGGGSGWKWFWRILTMLVIFLVAAGVGALIVFLLRKLRGGKSLQEGIASLEKTIAPVRTAERPGGKEKEGPAPATKGPPSFAPAFAEASGGGLPSRELRPAGKATEGKPTLTFAPAPPPVAAGGAASFMQSAEPKKEPSSGVSAAPDPSRKPPPVNPNPIPNPSPVPAPTPSWLQKGLDAAPAGKVESVSPLAATAKPATPQPPPQPQPQSADAPPWLSGPQMPKPAAQPASPKISTTPIPIPALAPSPAATIPASSLQSEPATPALKPTLNPTPIPNSSAISTPLATPTPTSMDDNPVAIVQVESLEKKPKK